MTYYVEAQTFEGGYNHSTIITTDVTTPMQVDLLVDSDNNDGFNIPDGSPLEDRLQTVPYSTSTPGKILIADGNDLNGNGSPDYADWAAGVAGSQFTPFQFRIPATTDLSKTTIEFDYSAADPSASGTPPGALRLWLKDASVAKSLSDYIPGNAAIAASTLPFGIASGGWLTLNGFIEAAMAGAQTITATATTGTSPATQSASDSANVNAENATLDIQTTDGSGQTLSLSAKNTSGGYALLNDDNDNGTFTGGIKRASGVGATALQPITSIAPLSDILYKGAKSIPAEHDLLPLTIHGTGPSGVYRLTFDSTEIRVWLAADESPVRNGPNLINSVVSGTTLLVVRGDLNIFVENINAKWGGQGKIDLQWALTAGPAPIPMGQFYTVDEVSVSGFSIEGPQYVVQNGSYTYTVSDPALGSWSFTDGSGGKPVDKGTNGQITVNFPTAAAMAQVIYTPETGFSGTRNVYVVGVSADAGAIKAPTAPLEALNLVSPAGALHIKPQAPQNGSTNVIDSTNTLTMQGYFDPILKQQRGLEYIQAGYVQTVHVTQINGTYANNLIRTSPLQNNDYVDVMTATTGAKPQLYSVWPWYDAGNYMPRDANDKKFLQLVSYDTLNAAKGAIKTGALKQPQGVDFNLHTVDQPMGMVFQTFDAGPKGFRLVKASIVEDFMTYVAARTLDPEASANNQYYMLAQAKWHMDDSGSAIAIGGRGFPVVRYTPKSAVSPNKSGMWVDGAAAPGDGVFSVVGGTLPTPPAFPPVNQVSTSQNDINNWKVSKAT